MATVTIGHLRTRLRTAQIEGDETMECILAERIQKRKHLGYAARLRTGETETCYRCNGEGCGSCCYCGLTPVA